MNLLLDTHAVLWSFTVDATLSEAAAAAIVDGANLVLVSAATAWEVAIKKALGKLRAPDDFEEQLVIHRPTPFDVTLRHALAVERLLPSTAIVGAESPPYRPSRPARSPSPSDG